jgi:transcriptional regulator with XRE-family HTH domain
MTGRVGSVIVDRRIAETIRKYAYQQSWSTAQLCDVFGVSRGMVSQYLRQTSSPSRKRLRIMLHDGGKVKAMASEILEILENNLTKKYCAYLRSNKDGRRLYIRY